MSANVEPASSGSGGACQAHGVYVGQRCPDCAKTSALSALRQATWEATQFLPVAAVREYVEGVLREVESDAP